MAANRKLLISAMVCATAIAGLTACSKTNDPAEGSGATKEPAAATSSKAPADPFEGLTADQIAEKGIDTAKSATSVRMAGKIKTDGELTDLDFAVDNKGACTGKMGVEGGTAELLQAANVMYMKGNDAFWTAIIKEDGASDEEAAGAAELFKGRWMKMPAEVKSEDGMDEICDLEAMIESMDEDKSDRKGMTKGPDAEVNGQPAATVVKKDPGGETTTVYVAKEGKPYLLKIHVVGGDEPGTMVFSDYDKPVNAVAPPADEVLDMEKLGEAGDSGAGAA
ncbi:hypothetical protein [Streptomyces sp. NPDC002889]|uniref:hypothetical protein n=1 Tax=Streptomyces sp. NPDC002889 TaxID=3364669 RepID=UPI0036747E93